MSVAANAQQEGLAREFITFAADAARAIEALDELHARQAREADLESEQLGLPEHPGFDRLAFICERERRFDDAIALCSEARRQGWHGDWDKRIARCTAKQAGRAKHPRHPDSHPRYPDAHSHR